MHGGSLTFDRRGYPRTVTPLQRYIDLIDPQDWDSVAVVHVFAAPGVG